MASVINASISSNGIVSTADASGILKVQSNGVTTNALAWVNFNGTGSSGSATIRSSYNVTSVTINATGDFTVNLTNATTDINYVPVISCSSTGSSNFVLGTINTILSSSANQAPTTTAFRVNTGVYAVGAQSATYVSVVVFGN